MLNQDRIWLLLLLLLHPLPLSFRENNVSKAKTKGIITITWQQRQLSKSQSAVVDSLIIQGRWAFLGPRPHALACRAAFSLIHSPFKPSHKETNSLSQGPRCVNVKNLSMLSELEQTNSTIIPKTLPNIQNYLATVQNSRVLQPPP